MTAPERLDWSKLQHLAMQLQMQANAKKSLALSRRGASNAEQNRRYRECAALSAASMLTRAVASNPASFASWYHETTGCEWEDVMRAVLT
jgi:hypothetical protein